MPGTVDAFAIGPKLKTFDLIGMNANVHIPFPAENLVSFADARPLPEEDMISEYLAVIALAYNLLDFSYRHYSVVPESPHQYHPQIVHRSLRTLLASLGGLFRSLVLPALMEMTLASVKSDKDAIACPRDALFHLHNLVLRSQCSLTTLSFINATMDDNLLPILQLSPQLVSLSFEDEEWTGDSVAAMQSVFIETAETILVGEAVHHMLIPRLKNLEMWKGKKAYLAVVFGFEDMLLIYAL